MAPRSLRRAIFSWILLLLVAAGICWISLRSDDRSAPAPAAGPTDPVAP